MCQGTMELNGLSWISASVHFVIHIKALHLFILMLTFIYLLWFFYSFVLSLLSVGLLYMKISHTNTELAAPNCTTFTQELWIPSYDPHPYEVTYLYGNAVLVYISFHILYDSCKIHMLSLIGFSPHNLVNQRSDVTWSCKCFWTASNAPSLQVKMIKHDPLAYVSLMGMFTKCSILLFI